VTSKAITGIILAAGESKRMGSPKALLAIQGNTFIRTIIGKHRQAGLEHIIVVTGANFHDVENEVSKLGVITAHNKEYIHGQLSSIHTGLRAAEQFQPDAILLHPVDHPLITADTITLLMEKYRAASLPIVLPVYQKKRGHPVIFSSTLFPDLYAAPRDIGARSVVWNHRADILEIETADTGIHQNIDTPETYENL
jgi:molybdenum cofactor cytidylyltransferase